MEGLDRPTDVVHNTESFTFDEQSTNSDGISSSPKSISIGVQTDFSMLDIENLEQNLSSLENEDKGLKEKIISMIPIDINRLQQDNEMVSFLTGIPNYLLLLSVFSFLADSISQTHRNCLTMFQEFLLTMMRLRLNLTFQDLAYRFNISKSTASRIFDKWIVVMARELKFLIKWPDREVLQKTMPHDFVQAYGRKVVVVIVQVIYWPVHALGAIINIIIQ